MSDINTEELRLYKNDKLYNGSRYKVYQDNKSMEEFLGQPDFVANVNYKSINQPIPINQFIRDCDEYTYGSITNQGKTYYFFVDNISTDAFQLTTIEYTIDWWSTNWSNVNPTKAHILRQNKLKPGYAQQPYTPQSLNGRYESIESNYVIVATYIPSVGETPSYICQVVLPGNMQNLIMVEQGFWYEVYGLAGADIKDCFIVPCFEYEDFGRTDTPGPEVDIFVVNVTEDISGLVELNKQWKERYENYKPPTAIVYNEATDKYYNCTFDESQITSAEFIGTSKDIAFMDYEEFLGRYSHGVFYRYKRSMYNTYRQDMTKPLVHHFTTTEKKVQGIMDWNGNIIWECPYGVDIDRFTIKLQFGISHIFVQFLIDDGTEMGNEGNLTGLLTNKGFTYDCRHPGLFVDSYQDYILKNRDYDVQMRRIQSERQELQAWVSAAENVGFGMAFGQAQGAAAAGIGGIIEAVGTTLLNQVFDPQIQKQYDQRYQRMTDQISLVGDTVTPLFYRELLYAYELEMDEATQIRMDDDISINGYYSDEVTDNLKDWFAEGRVIQADSVVVEGACNVIGKQQVVRRLQNGVEFI